MKKREKLLFFEKCPPFREIFEFYKKLVSKHSWCNNNYRLVSFFVVGYVVGPKSCRKIDIEIMMRARSRSSCTRICRNIISMTLPLERLWLNKQKTKKKWVNIFFRSFVINFGKQARKSGRYVDDPLKVEPNPLLWIDLSLKQCRKQLHA